jgi:hypothetical protein
VIRAKKGRAKQRGKQLAESQRRRTTECPPKDETPPKPKPEPVADRQKETPRQKLKRLGAPGAPNPNDPPGPLTPQMLSESEYMSLEWPPTAPNAPSIQFLLKITKRIVNLSQETVEIKSTPVEDAIHPRPLGFDPPLQQYSKDGAKGFRHNWEKLDHVFGLPNPYVFPRIPLLENDRQGVERYIKMCRRLAGFSLINDDTTLSVATDANGDWHVRVVDYPSDESFMGTSAAFRQLHNKGEPASFMNAYNALFKAMKTLTEEQHSAIRDTVLQWRRECDRGRDAGVLPGESGRSTSGGVVMRHCG